MTALAALLLISWTAPTLNTDGTALTDLDGFVVYCSQSQSSIETSAVVEVAASETSAPLVLAPGTWYCGVKARNTQDTHSVLSEIVTTVIEEPPPPPPPPPPPEEGPVTVSTVAVEIRFGKNGPWIARRVGTVALGTACIGDPLILRSGPDYYAVPRDKVKLTVGSVKATSAIAALCA